MGRTWTMPVEATVEMLGEEEEEEEEEEGGREEGEEGGRLIRGT